MKKKILIILITLSSINGFGQNENILYVVDSIPIIKEPKEGFGTLTENQIDNIVVVKDTKIIESSGYKDLNGIIYVFTKEYAKRSDSIKAIPTTKSMTKRNGDWYLKNNTTTYSGSFIDYNLIGKKQGEGVFFNGKLKGRRLLYYSNGNISDNIEYEKGIPNGLEQRFYEDGTLMQIGNFKNGKEVGVWKMYHQNGQLKQITPFKNGKMNGESITYYSTGKISIKEKFVNGTAQKAKVNDKFKKLYKEGLQLDKIGKFKSSIKKYTKCIEIDSTSAGAYFARGTAKLNKMEFDKAIIDFNKTIEIEPFHKKAYGNRAFSIIRKSEFKNSRTLTKNSYVTILASKDKVEITEDDLKKICKDLRKSTSLGVKNKMILDAKEKYCN